MVFRADRVGTVCGVVVRREGFARHRIRAVHWRHAMKANLAGYEARQAIEFRLEAVDAVFDLCIPEFELATPFAVPLLVEVKQQIHAPVPLTVFDKVKVHMDVQSAATVSEMHAATSELLVVK